MTIIKIVQIIIPVLVIALILFQQRGTALGSSFGGDSGGFYGTRRGAQEKIFYATIILVIAFLVLSIISLVIQ